MASVSFTNYREAYDFLFAARELGFTATHSNKVVTVGGVPCDDIRWEKLTDLLGPYRSLQTTD